VLQFVPGNAASHAVWGGIRNRRNARAVISRDI
jgi:hypothetical protein